MNLKFSNNELYPNTPTPLINVVRHRIGNVYRICDVDMFEGDGDIYVILAQVLNSQVVFKRLALLSKTIYTSSVAVEDLNDISADEFKEICAHETDKFEYEYVGRADDVLLWIIQRGI